jgi:hypothetical protein
MKHFQQKRQSFLMSHPYWLTRLAGLRNYWYQNRIPRVYPHKDWHNTPAKESKSNTQNHNATIKGIHNTVADAL